MASSRTLDVVAAAAKVGCHPETLRRAIRRKELLATRAPFSRGKRGYVIRVDDLAAFVEKRRLG